MKEATRKLLDKARRAIGAAETLLQAGDTQFAAGRAYYAMFYAAEVFLNELGFRFRKHGGVHAAFGEHCVKTGLIDAQYHRWLLAAFNKRIAGDYGVEVSFSRTEVHSMIQQSQEFLHEACTRLNAPL
jgi:uncharacterized protein (UPF0332 family)